MNAPKRRKLGWLLSSLTLIVSGLCLVIWYGISYARQTIWLGHEHLVMYSPKLAPSQKTATEPEAKKSAQGASRQAAAVHQISVQKSTASNTSKNWSSSKASKTSSVPVKTASSSHSATTAPTKRQIVLWPTLPEPGVKIGELKFPSLKLSVPVVQGTHWNQLSLGAGHYAASALPGQGGNVFVAGHRDTVFAPLRFLKRGALIDFDTPYGTFVYKAERFQIVSKYDTKPLSPTSYETLTLSTCYPFFYIGFAPNRYIIYTKLVSEPRSVAKANG